VFLFPGWVGAVLFEGWNLGPLERVSVEVARLTLFVGVNRAGKSIVARSLAAVTTALYRASVEYAKALAEKRWGRRLEVRPLSELFYEQLEGFVFEIPVRTGAKSAKIKLSYGGRVLLVEKDVLGNFKVGGDLVEAAAKQVEGSLRVGREGFFDFDPLFYPWSTLEWCNSLYPAAARWLASAFDIVVSQGTVFEGGVEVRNPSSMVVSLADLARRGGCRNLVLEEPEAHLHDDAVFELAKFLYAEASRGKGFLVTTHSDLLTAWIAALAAHPNPGELGVEVGERPSVKVYRFHLRRVGDAYAEELDLRGGEVDMDEAQLRVLENLERALRAVKNALRAGR